MVEMRLITTRASYGAPELSGSLGLLQGQLTRHHDAVQVIDMFELMDGQPVLQVVM